MTDASLITNGLIQQVTLRSTEALFDNLNDD